MKQQNNRLTALDALAWLGSALGTAVIAMLAGILTSGCSPRTVYVPQERVVMRTDTVHSATLRVDSVIFRDSVAVMQRGDTVYLTKYRDRYRVRERIDTLYQTYTDSVQVSVQVPVERKLTSWEKTKMEAGGWAIGAGSVLLLALVAVVVWLVKIKRRR